MTVRLLPALDRTARPWKNGGGVTRDVAVFPAEANDDDFLWRASVATIAAAGPFSPFPGIDRTLILLGGELVDARAEGLGVVVLRRVHDHPGAGAPSFGVVGGRRVGQGVLARVVVALPDRQPATEEEGPHGKNEREGEPRPRPEGHVHSVASGVMTRGDEGVPAPSLSTPSPRPRAGRPGP